MASTRTRAAFVGEPGGQWEVAEFELDEPKENEVRVALKAAGLCHSDEHVRAGSPSYRYPIIGGHEGAGVVEAVGAGVSRVKVGDHIATSFIPICGTCRYCSTGHQNLCDTGQYAAIGCLQDGTFRFHRDGADIGSICALGTFSERTVVSESSCVRIDDDLPFEVAALVSCGVTTGWGSAIYAAGVKAGDAVVIIGIGGVGINAVQGARYAGAQHIVAIDLVPFKLNMALKLGATFATSDPEEAARHIQEVTRGQLADHAIITVGVANLDTFKLAVSLIGKNSDVVVTSVGNSTSVSLALDPGPSLSTWQKRIQGSLFGNANPLRDIPLLLSLYRSGDLKIDELITARYQLDEINQAYTDMWDGKNMRGLVTFDGA